MYARAAPSFGLAHLPRHACHSPLGAGSSPHSLFILAAGLGWAVSLIDVGLGAAGRPGHAPE